jgi:YD repeat-containing protein
MIDNAASPAMFTALETSRTEASGTAQVRNMTTEWHADFNLPTRIIEPEREIIMSYDSSGRLLSRRVQPRGN